MKALSIALLIFDILLAIASAPFVAAYTLAAFLILVLPMWILMTWDSQYGSFEGVVAVLCVIIMWPYCIWKSILPARICAVLP